MKARMPLAQGWVHAAPEHRRGAGTKAQPRVQRPRSEAAGGYGPAALLQSATWKIPGGALKPHREGGRSSCCFPGCTRPPAGGGRPSHGDTHFLLNVSSALRLLSCAECRPPSRALILQRADC